MAIMATRHAVTTRRGSSHRFYEIPDSGGLKLPSVTTILQAMNKPALIPWAAKVEKEAAIEAASQLWQEAPKAKPMSREVFSATLTRRMGDVKQHAKKLEEAGNIGSAIHARIEWEMREKAGQRQGPAPLCEGAAGVAFQKFQEIERDMDFKPLLIEQHVWSRQHGFAGTMDMLCRVELPGFGEIVAVVDYKSGKGIYGEAPLQNVAYIRALIEMGHAKPPVHGLIVRLPKVESDKPPEVLHVPWDDSDRLFQRFLAVKTVWEYMQESEDWIECRIIDFDRARAEMADMLAGREV